jgi:ribosomal protein L37AE/L43A
VTEIIEGEIIEEETTNLPAVRAHEAMVTRGEVSVADVVAQRHKVKEVMDSVMQEGVHYGRIPGVDKPSLWKPGAEVLNVTFRLAPSYQSERIFHDDGHLTVVSKCQLTHVSGVFLGEGEGLCSSREDKYANRVAKRVCPACGKDSVIKGKQEFGGGWLCWKKNDGCGAKFADGDAAIESQVVGKVANEHLADSWNTVIKMANKRALVAASLNCTAASDIFTQDLEDTAVAVATSPANSQKKDLPGETFEDIFEDTEPTVAPSAAQKKKLDVLVGTLREADRLHTEHLYAAVAKMRGTDPDIWIEGAKSLSDDGELHWRPLRDSLTKAEASQLIERLGKLEEAA